MLACVRAYNDFLTDWCDADARRLLPITALPFWDVKASVAEIERCADAGPQGHALHRRAPVLRHARARRIRTGTRSGNRAQARDLPISFHIGAAISRATPSGPPSGSSLRRRRRQRHVHDAALFLKNAAQIVDLLFSGVLPRYPEPEVRLGRERHRLHPVRARGLPTTPSSTARSGEQRPEFKLMPARVLRPPGLRMLFLRGVRARASARRASRRTTSCSRPTTRIRSASTATCARRSTRGSRRRSPRIAASSCSTIRRGSTKSRRRIEPPTLARAS